MRILVLQDSTDMQQLLAHHLSKSGFDVDIAGTCATAIRKMAFQGYAWLILDYVLPDGISLDLIRVIPSQDSRKIIFASEARTPGVSQCALKLGVEAMFNKPEETFRMIEYICNTQKG